jgi:drug/metabolite transporter (DMT)-like permease
LFVAAAYVLSGVSQPLLMTLCKQAGLADPTAQFYMVFYYAGPSLLVIPLLRDNARHGTPWPSWIVLCEAAGIAGFDIVAQGLNYTGASLAGPTLFAIVYSSVTIWTAVFSRWLLQRQLSILQWLAVCMVFSGLVVTATDSIQLGPDVAHGTLLMVLGSCMHAATYVWSERIMLGEEGLTVTQNSAIQGLVALGLLCAWQCIYTAPRWHDLLSNPMHTAGTTFAQASGILLAFAVANLIHSVAFYHTIKHYPGGATSAGVMKGLQAVLVFAASHLLYCGRVGGHEMCFSTAKLASLVTVVGGVVAFGMATEQSRHNKEGYTQVNTATIETV